MIRPISASTPACYGVACPHHATCRRYAAVERTSPDHTIGTCSDGAGGWPLLSNPALLAQAQAATAAAKSGAC